MVDGVEIGTAYVTLAVSGQQVAPGVRKALGATGPEANRAGRTAGKSYSASFGSVLKGTLGAIGVAELTRAAIGFAKDSFAEAREAQKVGAQTEAVIRSSGGAAGLTAKQFGDLANSISKYAGIDDEAIQSAENLLATFRGIRNSGPDRIFDDTTRAAVDMSVALGTDARSAALQLGKALNDPTKGYAKLQRSGVTFTDSQIKQIKTLQKSGDLIGAQRVVLAELTKEFGGSAAAQATAGDKARVAYKNLQEQIGTALLPVLDKTARLISDDVVPAVSEFVSGIEDGTGAGGKFAGVLGDIYGFGKGVAGVIDDLPGPLKSTAIQAGIAYAVLSKFGPGLGAASTSIGTFATGLAKTETRAATTAKAMTGLKSAAGSAAGVGGLLALYQASQQTDKALGTLEGAAGGALLGFSVAGPYGAAIGAGVGAIGGLFSATKRSAEQFKRSSGQAQAYASSLDQVTGAATKSSRAQILADLVQNKTLQAGLNAGLTRRTLVDAALGKPAAIKSVQDALSGLNSEVDRLQKKQTSRRSTAKVETPDVARLNKEVARSKEQAKALTSLIGEQAESYAKDAKNTRLDTAAKLSQRDLLKTFPKALVTKIETPGFKASRDQVASLARAYKLQPRQLVTLARLEGYDLSLKQAHNLLAGYKQIKGPVHAKADLDDSAARRQGAALKRYLDDLARTRYVHYQVINPSTNKPKVGAGGQTGGRLAADTSSSGLRSTTDRPLVAHLYDEQGQLTASFRGLAEDTAYSVLKTEGVFG